MSGKTTKHKTKELVLMLGSREYVKDEFKGNESKNTVTSDYSYSSELKSIWVAKLKSKISKVLQ
jgi:hypothetical protein